MNTSFLALNLTLIETEEMENKKKINIFDEFLKNISKSSLMCSLFFHHGDYLLGYNAAISFFLCNMLHLKYWILQNQVHSKKNYIFLL